MANLKQSTIYNRMFLMVESADHITGLTGASPVVNLSKAGGSFAPAGGSVSEVANGFYKIALTTSDTVILGDLAFHITATSGDPSDFVDQVTANILGDTLPASVAGSVGSVTGNVGGNVLGTINGLTSTAKTDVGTTVLTTALTESYASLHSAPTLAQAVFEMRAMLTEKAVASTTVTTKKVDGSTSAATYTLNDATAPTSITRAS